MNLVYVGKIVNTHGLKGELRILSTFSFKDKIFKPGFLFYVDNDTFKLVSYRKHKNYDMVTFEGFNDINEVLFLKGKDIYFNRNDLSSDIILDSDLIDFKVKTTTGKVGILSSIEEGVKYSYFVILIGNKKHYVPKVDEFIENIDIKEKTIYIKEIEGLFDENWYFNSFF